MTDLDVRIVELPPLHYVAAYGFGREPEPLAWDKLLAWMKQRGLDFTGRRLFGFNNPSPTPGSPNYGYEEWLTMEAGRDSQHLAEAGGDIREGHFAGGLYAVARCAGVPNPEVWGRLVQWRTASPYRPAHHQWLEELLTPERIGQWDQVEFDLYLPIAR